ncbi:MAG: YfcE family phosphodiesterase [Eubacteriales bacterium]
MLKILIFSDSHGRTDGMLAALEGHPDATHCFHLGDGYRDAALVAAQRPGILFASVRGNCDGPFAEGAAEEMVLDLGGRRLWLCHGHRYGVKSGTEGLLGRAAEMDASLVLFGHTHRPLECYVGEPREVYLFNPGSIREGSYGLLRLDRCRVLFSHCHMPPARSW